MRGLEGAPGSSTRSLGGSFSSLEVISKGFAVIGAHFDIDASDFDGFGHWVFSKEKPRTGRGNMANW
jgi:hypothetical protein